MARLLFILLSCLSASAAEQNSIGMKLVRIQSGEYLRGAAHQDLINKHHKYSATARNRNAAGVTPAHPVRISKGFHIGAHEVTVGEFRQFVSATGYQTSIEKSGQGALAFFPDEAPGLKRFQVKPDCIWRNPGFKQTDKHPVVCVSWRDTQAFCQWLSQKEGRSYRLPTEAEWEYAARAGTTTMYLGGNSPDSVYAYGNVADAALESAHPNSVRRQRIAALGPGNGDGIVFTAPVARFKANPWGLHDTHGNVWEWCSDRYAIDTYSILFKAAAKRGSPINPAPTIDPQGPTKTLNDQYGNWRVIRGGSWINSPTTTRVSWRSFWEAHDAASYLGFRVVREER